MSERIDKSHRMPARLVVAKIHPNQPDFIRLRVAPLPKQTLIGSTPATGNKPVAKATLTANVTKESNGDVVINSVTHHSAPVPPSSSERPGR